MAFDDLIKGLAVFNSGLKDLAISHATNDANEQLNQLNTQALSREDQIKAQSAIGNSLALRLQGVGADGADIAATAHRLSPSAGEMYQAQTAQDQQESSQKFGHTEGRLKAQDAINIEEMKLRALQGKEGKAQLKMLDGFGKEMDKMPGFKDMATNAPKLQDALEKIKENKGGFGITSMINMAQLGMIRGVAGRVNEKEIEGANESQSKRAQLWKKMGLEATGEVPMNIQDFWQKVIQRSKDNLDLHMKDQIRGFAKSKELISDGDIESDKVEKSLLMRYNLASGSAAPPPAKTPGPAARSATSPVGGLVPQKPGLAPGFSPIEQ